MLASDVPFSFWRVFVVTLLLCAWAAHVSLTIPPAYHVGQNEETKSASYALLP